MKRYACFLLAILLLAPRADASCGATTKHYTCKGGLSADCGLAIDHYDCEDGTVEDFENIPDYAVNISIINMPLRRINTSLFARFAHNLQGLSCSRCRIDEIEDNAFGGLTRLKTLQLNDNSLRRVSASWFGPYGIGLEELELRQNKIDHIDEQAFSNLTELRHLKLDDNDLGGLVTKWFGEKIPLQSLSARMGKIKYIDSKLISMAHKLEHLDVSENALNCSYSMYLLRSHMIQLEEMSDQGMTNFTARSNFCVKCSAMPGMPGETLHGGFVIDMPVDMH